MQERIFLEKELYEIDDIDDGLTIELTDGVVTNVNLKNEFEEGTRHTSYYCSDKEEEEIFKGVKYLALCDLEEDIGCAYEEEDEELVKKFNTICTQINEFYKKNQEYFDKLLKEYEEKLEEFAISEGLEYLYKKRD